MRHTRLTTALTALIVGGTLLAPSAGAAVPPTDLQPQRLPRGADVGVPHIDAGDFVDGARRVELPGTVARVIGRSGGSWMVGTNNVDVRRNQRVVRVSADGSVSDVLRQVDPSAVVLSEDGSSLLAVDRPRRGSATVRVWAPVDGAQIAERTFRGHPEIVTASGPKVLLRTHGRTFWWKWARDHVRRVTSRLTGPASIEHDLLTTYTKDPYLGGCTRLARLRRPTVTTWTSCRDRIAAFSPDGTQMLTFPILTDGLGPGELHLREIDGTAVATFTTGWFSGWGWESPGTLLLDVNGTRRFATVRCTPDACENATDPVPVPAP